MGICIYRFPKQIFRIKFSKGATPKEEIYENWNVLTNKQINNLGLAKQIFDWFLEEESKTPIEESDCTQDE